MNERPVVLLVEDETDTAEVLAETLEQEGMEAIIAGDGRRALAVLDHLRRTPDLIVTDMVMPIMDGLSFLREYYHRSGKHADVIAMSAMAAYLTEAHALGAVATLQKPFTLEAFTDIVNRVRRGVSVEPTPGAPLNANAERERIRQILELSLDKPAPGEALHRYVDRVAKAFDVPICLVSIVTETEQAWTAGCGIPADLAATRRAPRSESFCTHAVVARAALIVQDASYNPLFAGNPWVKDRNIRFYAGVPLVARSGEVLGTLCLLDYRPRAFGHYDLSLLSILAKRVLAEFELRERSRHQAGPDVGYQYTRYIDENFGVFGRDAIVDLISAEAFRHTEKQQQASVVVLSAPADDLRKMIGIIEQTFDPAWVGRLATERLAVIVPQLAPAPAKERLAAALGPGVRIAARQIGGRPLHTELDLRALEMSVQDEPEA